MGRMEILQLILKGEGKGYINYDKYLQSKLDGMWFRKFFELDNIIIKTQDDGTAPVLIKEQPINETRMMEGRALWTPVEGYDQEYGAAFNDSLGDFGSGFKFNQKDLVYEDAILKKYNDSDMAYLMARVMNNVSDHVAGAFQTLSVMASQKMQYGEYLVKGNRGIPQGGLNQLPDSAYRKCGKVVWADPTATIFEDMQKIEQKFKEETGNIDVPLTWKMSTKVIPILLQNEEIKSYLSNLLTIDTNGNIQQTKTTMTKGLLLKFFEENTDVVSPIEFVDSNVENIANEQQVGKTVVNTRKPISAWNENLVVLSFAGNNGVIKKGESLETKYLEGYDIYVQSIFDGLINIRTQQKKETWIPSTHTNLLMSAGAYLTHWNHHWVIDITQAGTSQDPYGVRAYVSPFI